MSMSMYKSAPFHAQRGWYRFEDYKILLLSKMACEDSFTRLFFDYFDNKTKQYPFDLIV